MLFCEKFGAGVDSAKPGTAVCRLAPVLFRCTDAMPAKFSPEDDRWKMGWFGRPGASDILEPEVERICDRPPVIGACGRLE